MRITLDDRFTITATGWSDGWRWAIYDEVGDFKFEAPEPAKDQTEVFLLAAEVIKGRY